MKLKQVTIHAEEQSWVRVRGVRVLSFLNLFFQILNMALIVSLPMQDVCQVSRRVFMAIFVLSLRITDSPPDCLLAFGTMSHQFSILHQGSYPQ
jgi:hypothetical protein